LSIYLTVRSREAGWRSRLARDVGAGGAIRPRE
jgi:hypothetical protein